MENNGNKKFYQNKWAIIAIVGVVILIGALGLANKGTGTGDSVASNAGAEDTTTENNNNEEAIKEQEKQDEANGEVVAKVQETLNNNNVTEIDVITDSESQTEQVYLQLKLEVEKAAVDKAAVEEQVKGIVEQVKGVSGDCQMEVVDVNNELVALYLDGSVEFKEE